MLGGKMKKSHIQIFYNEYSETPIKPGKLKNDENNSENNSKVSYTIWMNVWGADGKCWGAENKVFEKCYIFKKKSLYIYQHYITPTPPQPHPQFL